MCALVSKRAASEQLFSKLHGLFAVYKPRDLTGDKLVEMLKYALNSGLNERACRPMESIVRIDEEQNWVSKQVNLADSPLGMRGSSRQVLAPRSRSKPSVD
jgi:hypothetical protein